MQSSFQGSRFDSVGLYRPIQMLTFYCTDIGAEHHGTSWTKQVQTTATPFGGSFICPADRKAASTQRRRDRWSRRKAFHQRLIL